MISDERLEQFAHDKRMCNVTEEIVSMAKELLAQRKAFTQPIVWIHQTTGEKLNNSVIEDVRKQSGAWIPLYRKPNLPL
jgi:hypothetical protein